MGHHRPDESGPLPGDVQLSKPILCVDFDGVIHSYTSGWKGVDVIPDPPVKGAFDWLRCVSAAFDVVIYSSRSQDLAGVEAMKEWFYRHGFDEASIRFASEKPAAFLTIDDRAIRFDGNFEALTPEHLRAFKPWNKV